MKDLTKIVVDNILEVVEEALESNTTVTLAGVKFAKKDKNRVRKYLVVYDDDVCTKYNHFKYAVVTDEKLFELRNEPFEINEEYEYGDICKIAELEFNDIAKFFEITDEEIYVLEKFDIL